MYLRFKATVLWRRSESRSSAEKAPAPAAPTSRAGDHGHKAGRARGGEEGERDGREEEETPEAREGVGGTPAAWVRGRGVRLEASHG